MKKLFQFFIVFLTIISIAIPISAKSESYGWFCAHKKDHTQPCVDSSIAFIEEYGGIYIDKKHGDRCDEKVIYLTFDAGYENGNIKRILDILKKENAPAAFFVLGHLVENNTDLVIRMFEEGHLVCNHTFSHQSMINKSEEDFYEELSKLENSCINKTGHKISKYYRPPEGKFDKATLSFAQKMNYKTVFWSFGYEDWDNNNQMPADKAMKKILDNIHNGEIMLLHPTSSTNAEILENIIKELKNQGYRFASLDEITI